VLPLRRHRLISTERISWDEAFGAIRRPHVVRSANNNRITFSDFLQPVNPLKLSSVLARASWPASRKRRGLFKLVLAVEDLGEHQL
jgi:hypothetical protein